jgi:prepilin-type N-terminal cleavage/methylation domain-containing protein
MLKLAGFAILSKVKLAFQQKRLVMKNEKGFALVEALVAIVILGVLAAAFAGGLSTGFKVLTTTDERQTAKSLAESQLEYAKGFSGLLPSYNPDNTTLAEYPGYTVTINGTAIDLRDENIQKISVIVSHQGRPIILVGNATLEGFKVK